MCWPIEILSNTIYSHKIIIKQIIPLTTTECYSIAVKIQLNSCFNILMSSVQMPNMLDVLKGEIHIM